MTDIRESEAHEASEASGKRHRGPGFWLLVLLAVLIVVPALLIGALLLALRSETGTAWVFDQIAGLEVTEGRGSLLGQWQAAALSWQGYGIGVDVESPVVEWSPGCLFGKELCLDRLQAQAVDVTLTGPENEDSQPAEIALPGLDLPIALAINTIDIGPLTVNEQVVWDQFRLSASGSGSAWKISQLVFQRGAIALDSSGRLQTRGDWPVDLGVEAEIPAPGDDEWLLDLDLTGSVTDLSVRGDSQGYLNGSLSGQVQPLKPAVPAQLRLQTQRFKASEAIPETLTLLDTEIAFEGSVADGFQTKGNGRLQGAGNSADGDLGLTAEGHITTTGVRQLELRLTGAGIGSSETGTASVEGDLSWSQAFAVNAQLVLDAFPWFSLVPGLEAPPVVLNRLDGEFSYQGGDYNATLEAVVDGPQGKANLASRIDGDLESLQLSGLRANTGAGFMSGQATIGFAGPLTWQTSLQLSHFNPGYWMPSLEAGLSGDVTSEGRLSPDGPPDITAAWDLSGTWRASNAAIRGNLDQSRDTLVLSDLQLQVDDNRISGEGSWGPAVSGNFKLNLPEPELLLQELEGVFSGEISVSGTPESPTGSVSLTGKDLGWNERVEVEQFDLVASLSEGQSLAGDLTATNLAAAGQSLETLSFELSGTPEDHRLSVSAIHSDADLVLGFIGAISPEWSSWDGQLEKGEIDVTTQGQFWRLKQPADLTYNTTGRLTFGKHCWVWEDASVCAGAQTLFPDTALDYRIRSFPTTALSPLLPDTLRWDTILDADLVFETTESGARGSFSVDAGSGAFSVLNADEWEKFGYSALTSTVEFLPETANLSLELRGPRLGTVTADVSVDPLSDTRDLDGTFRVSELDIALAAVFAGLEEVRGELNGQGQISGPLMKPSFDGKLAMTGGEISDPSLPLPLKDIMVDLTLNGYTADISGRWQSNDRSSGNVKGSAGWESGFAADLRLTGERLPFQYEPYARVEVEPDLQISYGADGLSISGRVAVPRGEIEISELPEQAVSVSEDQVIVGSEQEQSRPLAIDLDITVVVGEDRVTFNGFEVIGNLEGTLRIRNDMDTRGALRLVDGRYEAYGQDLELRRARLVFTGPLTEPYLDIEAIRRVDTVVAGIRLTGPVSAPQTEIFSEPTMPQTDALSYLILGRAPEAPREGEEGQMRNAAIALGLNQTSGITRGIGEELGIEELTLETRGSGNNVSVVASGELTDDLSLRYGVGIFEPISTVALRYDLGRYFYLEAASGLAASLDIFYTRDF